VSHQPYLSILIPLFDERDSISEMHAQVTDACVKLGRTYEILWIDDGSRDGSGALLDELAARDPRCRVVTSAATSASRPRWRPGSSGCAGRSCSPSTPTCRTTRR
jgi:glycosyltransferase involved in cell wall biosynthesis